MASITVHHACGHNQLGNDAPQIEASKELSVLPAERW